MPPPRLPMPTLTLALAFVLVLAACGRPEAATATVTSAAPAPTTPSSPQTQAPAGVHYRCGAHHVQILDGAAARITLSDGVEVRAGLIVGSRPTTFAGRGLTLVELGQGRAELSDDTGQAQPCLLDTGRGDP